MNKNQIIIGTAQLNNIYGRSHKKIKLNKSAFLKLIKFARKENISSFDCASSYGNQKILADFLYKRDFVISKINFNLKNSDKEPAILKEVNKTLSELNKKQINGLLIHNTKYIYNKKFKRFYELLNKQKSKFKKIGFSCYTIKEVKYILKHYKFEILQFPFNIFDQRLILEKKMLQELKLKKVEIHIRSIFLQGVLLKKDNLKDKYFKKWKKLFIKFEKFKLVNKIGDIEACLAFLKQYKFYKKVVVGFDSSEHLENFIKILKKRVRYNNYNFKQFANNEPKLILPKLWSK